jgi:hypothetical protein
MTKPQPLLTHARTGPWPKGEIRNLDAPPPWLTGEAGERWRKLPKKFHRRWWRETDYGARKPSAELIEAFWTTPPQRQPTTSQPVDDDPLISTAKDCKRQKSGIHCGGGTPTFARKSSRPRRHLGGIIRSSYADGMGTTCMVEVCITLSGRYPEVRIA